MSKRLRLGGANRILIRLRSQLLSYLIGGASATAPRASYSPNRRLRGQALLSRPALLVISEVAPRCRELILRVLILPSDPAAWHHAGVSFSKAARNITSSRCKKENFGGSLRPSFSHAFGQHL